jgi:hypothetical protein
MLPIQQYTYHTMPNIIPEKYLHIFMQNRQTRHESFVYYDLRVQGASGIVARFVTQI